MNIEAQRAIFECWIRRRPYHLPTDRFEKPPSLKGQYIRHDVQIAWEAWKEAQKQFAKKEAKE